MATTLNRKPNIGSSTGNSTTCTCGHNYSNANQDNDDSSQEGRLQEDQSKSSDQHPEQGVYNIKASLPLDTSFVQIPMIHTIPAITSSQPTSHDRISRKIENYSAPEQNGCRSNSNAHYTHYITQLFEAVSSNSDSKVPSLCQTCVQRIEETLMADTERLLAESLMYEQAIVDDLAYKKGWNQMMYRATAFDFDQQEITSSEAPETEGGPILNDAEQYVEDTYLREIQLLEQACREQREELAQLRSIQKEQVLAYDELQQYSESLAAEENALELEARAFDNDQEQLSRMLAEIHNEIDRLTSPEIRLPALLVQLNIDVERGLRYPLINELRLAYRPKGDVHRMEIQAAWALAASLLLVVATIFQFQSQNWKIVPLSHCAKLIFCPTSSAENAKTKTEKNRVVVFNLGHPKTNGSKALLAWNALLCQVTHHVLQKTSDAIQKGILEALEMPQIPFEISPNSIGGVQLTQLQENDDSGWSRVIHCMASNLQWLSKCASIYVLHQVVLLTPLQDVEAKILNDKEK